MPAFDLFILVLCLSLSLSLSLSTLILAVIGETPFLPVGEKKEEKKREGK